MAEPTLLYCLGATKAGTSWLHRYLSDHPQARMPSIKELHYWDAVATGTWDVWIRDTAKKHAEHLARAESGPQPKRERQLRMADDALAWIEVLEKRQRDDAAYLGFLHRRVRDHALVGDLTPAYGLLSEDWLRAMAGAAERTRFVYVLRDPVERLWSHCRMIARRRAGTEAEVAERANNILKRTLQGKEDEIAQRCDYAGPLGRMRAAVPAERLHVVFYEELFTQGAVDALCDFLGLSRQPGDFGHVIMASPEAEMAAGHRAAAHDWLAPQYAWARTVFDRLPDAWGAQRVEI